MFARNLRMILAVFAAWALVSSAAPACEVTVEGTRLLRCGEPFRIIGANYYPKDAAWHGFWSEYSSNSQQIDTELDRARELGVNTLRIFLIFGFFADGSSPHLTELEDFLDRLEARNLSALVTFFDFYLDSADPYCDSESPCDYGASRQHVDAVLNAVGNHPAILGWDLKNEMDKDYGRPELGFTTEDVKAWARFMAEYLQARTDRPITLGFSGATPENTFDPDLVAELACSVDIVSFHWFLQEGRFEGALATLQERLARQPCPRRPVLLEEFGLHTLDCPPENPCPDNHTETEQAAYYNALLSLSEAGGLAGTLFWTLSDFSFIFPGAPDTEHCLGVLRNSQRWQEPECDPPARKHCSCEVSDPEDYSEKPSAAVVRAHSEELLYLDLFNGWVDLNAGPPPPGWEDNFTDEFGDLLGGAIFRGYNPDQLLWSHTPGHVALTKSVAPKGVSIVGWSRSPLLRDVDLDRFPIFTGKISSYSIKDPVFGSDSFLHVGIQEEGFPVTRLLTVGPEDSLPLDFRFDLRTVLQTASRPNLRIVLELEKANGGNGYSASYEIDFVRLGSR